MISSHWQANNPLVYLSAEGAGVLGVLRDFDLLDHLPQRGTISGTIFTNDSDLLRTLGLEEN